MSNLVHIEAMIPAMTLEGIEKVRKIESLVKQLPQTDIATHHVLHGGMYARTVVIPAGSVMTGALIKVPTILIMDGHATVTIGEESVELDGYHVLPASRGRKQVFITHKDTTLTMVYVTDAWTVQDAEEGFTDEWVHLVSRKSDSINIVINTGE